MRYLLFACTIFFLGTGTIASQNKMATSTRQTIKHIANDFPIDRLDEPAWSGASQTFITKYWSGKVAPTGRQSSARMLWSSAALYVRFDASQSEPLIVSERPDLLKKTIGLWDRDVCEIFVAPDKDNGHKYFEFEIAPTGEWVDLAIAFTSQKRKTDLDYDSGMTSAARIETNKIVSAIRIPWEAFGARPKVGDVWLGNLFRCIGKDPNRGYLAWRPTRTAKPNFHVPDAFGQFHFVE